MVPMLDVQMGVVHGEEREVIRYDFFEKEVTSNKVLKQCISGRK